ncbi:D-alanyl-D-alanine carboxypeptidase [Candidatus Kaiserbacteria bacterium]|nr:D-alanyl-D-alanine carboxypeptidase [Candidatus Kaiserbacteria bacterium]
MQDQPSDRISRIPFDYGRKRKFLGATLLALLFCASATVTFAYLSDVPAVTIGGQPAAVSASGKPDAFADVTLQAQAAYVKDLATGKVLYAYNATTPLPLASLTKVAMALAVSEVIPPGDVVTLPRDLAAPGSTKRLPAGQEWRLRDVMNFTLVTSSNEGAELLASVADRAIRSRYPQAPSGGAAVWRMNDIARMLGLSGMYFLNPSGLDVSTTQAGAYGSAHDIAILFAYAASTTPGTFVGTTRDGVLLTSINGAQTSASNTDKVLGSIPGLIMGKTGYTDLAGGNLAVLFDVGLLHPVVAVVLGSTYDGRFDDMKQLVAASQVAVAQ